MKQAMKRLLIISFLALLSFAVKGQQVLLPYLGQEPPGMTPELFAPDIIATGFYERDITIHKA
jgi:hypothetical protein